MKRFRKWIGVVTAVCMLLPATILFSSAEASENTANLVAYYEFEDAANLGKDSTGNGNDLNKVINADNISTETGVKGNALKLAGNAGLAAWKDGATSDFMDAVAAGEKGYTVSFYAKVDTANSSSDGSNCRVFCNGWNGASQGMSVLMNRNGDGSVACLAPFGGLQWWDTYSGIGTEAAGAWHHIVTVYNPNNDGSGLYSVYVDGIRTVNLTCTANEPVSSPDWFFCIGGAWTSQRDWYPNDTVTTESFVGSVDEFKIFDGAVYDLDFIKAATPGTEEPGDQPGESGDSGETGGGSEEASNLVAYYEFEDAANLGKDSTGNGNDLNKVINADNISTETGVKGNALKLAGNAGLAAWQDGATSDFMDAVAAGEKGYTVSLYAKVDLANCKGEGTNSRVLCNGWNGTSQGMSVVMNRNSDGSIACLAPFGSLQWWDTYSGIGGNKAGDWHHIVTVYNPNSDGSGLYSVYIDGVRTVNLTCSASEPAANPDWFFCIGGAWTSQKDWFPDDSVTMDSFIGSVDEVKIFNEAIYDMEYIRNGVPAPGSSDAPQTGDETPIAVFAMIMLAAAGAAVVLVRTKRFVG